MKNQRSLKVTPIQMRNVFSFKNAAWVPLVRTYCAERLNTERVLGMGNPKPAVTPYSSSARTPSTPFLESEVRPYRQTIVVHVRHTCAKCCRNATSNDSIPCYRSSSRIAITSLRNFVRIVTQIMPRRKDDSQRCNMLFPKLMGVLRSKIQLITLYSHIRLYCNRKYT